MKKSPSTDSTTSSVGDPAKARRCERFHITLPNESPITAKLCRLRKSKSYNGYGSVLRYHQHLHIIEEVEVSSPSYRAGLRANDVVIFVGKTNVERMTHEDIKTMIRAMALSSHHVELIVLAKTDLPRYRTLRERDSIDWSVMGLERSFVSLSK